MHSASQPSVYNDIDLAAIAESESGKLIAKTKNALFVSVGEGMADTIFIDDKIVHGSHYRGGEIGFVVGYSEFLGQYKRIGEIAPCTASRTTPKPISAGIPERSRL